MSSFRVPKSFKPAALDTGVVDPASLTSKKQQLWHFTFPLDFNIAAFSELQLELPAEPVCTGPGSLAQTVTRFELDGVSYRVIEGSVFEAGDVINLFPSLEDPGQLVPGKPFTRAFRICREIAFHAAPEPMTPNPRGRAPDQLQGMKKNFFPIGYINESLKEELAAGDKQGRVLRSTSSRPGSPRLLPLHGFDINEWYPAGVKGSLSKKKSSSSSKSSTSDSSKKDSKKEKKRSVDSASVEESASKKQKKSTEDEEGAKKKKHKKEK